MCVHPFVSPLFSQWGGRTQDHSELTFLLSTCAQAFCGEWFQYLKSTAFGLKELFCQAKLLPCCLYFFHLLPLLREWPDGMTLSLVTSLSLMSLPLWKKTHDVPVKILGTLFSRDDLPELRGILGCGSYPHDRCLAFLVEQHHTNSLCRFCSSRHS